jgi:hypothetical protein
MICTKTGVTVTYKSDQTQDGVLVQALLLPNSRNNDMFGTNTGRKFATFQIPRQAGFTPESFIIGASINYNDTTYRVKEIDSDNEDWEQASIFTFDCEQDDLEML